MSSLKFIKKHLKKHNNWAAKQTRKQLKAASEEKSFFKLCEQIKPGELTVLAGRPGSGDLALTLSIISEFSIERQMPVVFFNHGLGIDFTTRLLIGQRSSINPRKLSGRPHLSTKEHQRYCAALDELKAAPLMLDDKKHTVESLQKSFDKAHHLLDKSTATTSYKNMSVISWLLVLDISSLSSGLEDSPSKEVGNNSMVTHWILQLNRLTKQYNVAVLCVTGICRSVEERSSKRPEVTDVEHWEDLKPGVDKVALVYREALYFPKKAKTGNEFIEINLSKPDQTPLDKFLMRFDPSRNIFPDR